MAVAEAAAPVVAPQAPTNLLRAGASLLKLSWFCPPPAHAITADGELKVTTATQTVRAAGGAAGGCTEAGSSRCV